jgi:hypothetical protein
LPLPSLASVGMSLRRIRSNGLKSKVPRLKKTLRARLVKRRLRKGVKIKFSKTPRSRIKTMTRMSSLRTMIQTKKIKIRMQKKSKLMFSFSSKQNLIP